MNLIIKEEFTIFDEKILYNDLTLTWDEIKTKCSFNIIREQAKKYSFLEFNSIQEIEEEFDESDMFNLCNMIANAVK